MSTCDAPGYSAKDSDSAGDELHVGCWAEHSDGSLLFVKGVDGKRVIYSLYDLEVIPVVEFSDSMPLKDFLKFYSRGGGSGSKWIWHDKTSFPWNKVIKKGARDGVSGGSARDIINAATRVAKRLGLSARAVKGSDADEYNAVARPKNARKISRVEQKNLVMLVDKLKKSLDSW